MTSQSQLASPLLNPLLFLYQIIQWLINYTLSPNPPKSDAELSRPKIAIIGAGITGISAAAHCVGHGFDVTIFDAGPKEQLGGIWSVSIRGNRKMGSLANASQRVNDTSGLQIHSVMYRFHPSVKWQRGYPDRKQIINQVTELWKRYRLQKKTRFNFKVTKAYQDENSRWIINDASNGRFEGLIAAVGTCGDIKMPNVPGLDKFKGEVYHSSQLTGYVCNVKSLVSAPSDFATGKTPRARDWPLSAAAHPPSRLSNLLRPPMPPRYPSSRAQTNGSFHAMSS
jgi:hypothetical protein